MSAELTLEDFPAFFRALNGGRDPFPWQSRLAARACVGNWPQVLALPTGTGKTNCLDIAVFAMALRQQGPRRIFFVVDRRVVVDQAYEHMRAVCETLRSATGGVLDSVRERLQSLGGTPDAYQMRGGIYRDDSWVRSPMQPMLIASTVDQVGSRLLFRGYGASESTWPVHAALTANDSLILLDEAHCAAAFEKTVKAVARYRMVGVRALQTPFAFVRMTATPGAADEDVFGLDEADLTHEVLQQRLRTAKKTTLVAVSARPKDFGKLADRFAEEARELAKHSGVRRIAVIVNRVRTAKAVYGLLREAGQSAHLLIGRMRPVDRQNLPAELEAMKSGRARAEEGLTTFVVATQCLEVGADLDFDGMVTECASIDSLLQRFGRLDRVGALRGRARGRILIASHQTEDKYVDPIYGSALQKTWKWLRGLGEEVDFAIRTEDGSGVNEQLRAGGDLRELRRESPPTPALLPAHVDILAQTSPPPSPEPDPHLFLHGKENTSPDVQVVWRADLTGASPADWAETLALCPPISLEGMPVPLAEFRRWLSTQEPASGADVESGEVVVEMREESTALRCPVLLWRGRESCLARGSSDIGPGDTVILDMSAGGFDDLGHVPEGCEPDAAERARIGMPRRMSVRLHESVLAQWPQNEAMAALVEASKAAEATPEELVESFRRYQEHLPDGHWLRRIVLRSVRSEPYPESRGEHAGWVLTEGGPEADSGDDESSSGEPVLLADHLEHVTASVHDLAALLLEDAGLRESVVRAASKHDIGKSDVRFQALLRGGDLLAAQFAPVMLAKGRRAKASWKARQAQYERSGLPDGFRHELNSLAQLRAVEKDELVLHLVASHHGRCRPFAPFVDDPADVHPAHRLDSGVADRFWKLTRKYGWWGLAYLEAVLRLGDWNASAEEAQ